MLERLLRTANGRNFKRLDSQSGAGNFAYLTGTFKNFERKLGYEIRMWLVLTRYQKRCCLTEEIMEKLLQYFPKRVLPTRIRETAALAECPSFGQTIFEYRKNSNGAHDYRSLASDLIEQRTH